MAPSKRKRSAAAPVTKTPEPVLAALQQYAADFDAIFKKNQDSYNNVVRLAATVDYKGTKANITTMAKAIDANKLSIPFGSLMAIAQHESGFSYQITSTAKAKIWVKALSETGEPIWISSPTPKQPNRKVIKTEKVLSTGEGAYMLMTEHIKTGEWARVGIKTVDDAKDPDTASRGVALSFGRWTKYIYKEAPVAQTDLVLFTMLCYIMHHGGPGLMINYIKRSQKLFNYVTVDSLMSFSGPKQPVIVGDKVYDRGGYRVMLSYLEVGLLAPIWEARRKALLEGKNINNSAETIANLIKSAKTVGQAAMQAAVASTMTGQARGTALARTGTRKQGFEEAKRTGNDDQRNAGDKIGAQGKQAIAAKVDVSKLAGVSPIGWVYDFGGSQAGRWVYKS